MSDENDSWLEGIGVCVQKFFSSDPDQGGSTQAPPAPPPAATPAPATSSSDPNQCQSPPENGANKSIGPPAPPQPAADGGFTPAPGAKSSDPNVGGSSKDPRAVQADYDQGFVDGRNGRESTPVPRAGEAYDAYEKGYAKGRDEYLKKVDEDRQHTLGHVVIHGVEHVILHMLHLGGGLWTLVVTTTAGMGCDTKWWRFKCPTCGMQGELKCTEDEARADATEHRERNPNHFPQPVHTGVQE